MIRDNTERSSFKKKSYLVADKAMRRFALLVVVLLAVFFAGCGLAKKAPRKGPSESSELLQGLREQAKLRAAGPKQHLAAHRRCVELCVRTGLAKDQCFPACKWVFFVPDPAALLADAHAPEEDAAVMRIVRWCRAHGNDAKKAAELFFRDPVFRPKRPADADADAASAAAEMRPEADAEADAAAAAAAMSEEEGEKSAAETTEAATTGEEEGEAQQQTKRFKGKSAFEEFRRKRGKPIRDEL